MTIKKRLVTVLLGAVLVCWGNAVFAADAKQPTPARKASKARTRLFNPFSVQQSRIKISRLGYFSFPGDVPLFGTPGGALQASAVNGASSTVAASEAVAPVASSIGTIAPAASGPADTGSVPAVATNSAATLSTNAGSSVETGGALATSVELVNRSPGLAVGAMRDPYRPPVRSPFRPPPRPPF